MVIPKYIYSNYDGLVACFQFGATRKNAAATFLCMSLDHTHAFPSDIHRGVELMSQYIMRKLNFSN